MRITLFVPCFVDQLYPNVGKAVVTVLRKLGHEVVVPEGQTCCGQPAFNAGFHDEARSVARHTMNVMAGSDLVVVPSGSCATMIRHFYPEIFDNTGRHKEAEALAERTYEFSELLVDVLGVTELDATFDGKATFHDGCHGLRELGVKTAPRKLLENVKGLELVEMDAAETCCGFGGTFAVKFPQISTAMAETKLESVKRTETKTVISNDPSCLMQIGGYAEKQGHPVRCLHTAEVLAHSEEL